MTTQPKFEDLIGNGKTKRVYAYGPQGSTQCELENTDAVTKNDNPDSTIHLQGKGKWSNTTTCRVFKLLKDAGLPVAFDHQQSPTTFVAPYCKMIPLECIARRTATGSFCKRNPDIPDGHRFNRLRTEYFLKTSNGVLKTFGGEERQLGLSRDCGQEDPLIVDPFDTDVDWALQHSKLPASDPTAALAPLVSQHWVIPPNVTVEQIDALVRRAFLVLERAWAILGFRLVDFKLEFGIDAFGKLLIADVIDADSWRLKDETGGECSKQLFRDDRPATELEEKYRLVAAMVERFRIPKQVLVLVGRCAAKLCFPGVTIVDIATVTTEAGSDEAFVQEVADGICTTYPSGGVFADLSGVYCERTLQMFRDRLPMPFIGAGADRVPRALDILAQSNPAVYAYQRFLAEESMA